MALTDAQRQKRYAHHRAGDHSFCDPKRGCRLDPGQEPKPLAGKPVPKAERKPAGFGPRGQELWDAMSRVDMGPAHQVLLVEACRLVDRLDRFDRTLSGGYWFFERMAETAPGEPERVEVVIDNVLSEARQYASALKQIVAELEPKPSSAVAPSKPATKADGIASLTDRINARRAGTA